MIRRTYHVILALSSPLPVMGAYVIGKPLAAWLAALDDDVAASLTLLGYALGLLVAVLVWGLVLLPLRARAGYPPIAQDIAQLRNEGLTDAVTRELAALREREQARDPKTRAGFHALMALVGALLSLAAAGLTWALWQDERVFIWLLAAAIVCPGYTVYHLVQWLRFHRKHP